MILLGTDIWEPVSSSSWTLPQHLLPLLILIGIPLLSFIVTMSIRAFLGLVSPSQSLRVLLGKETHLYSMNSIMPLPLYFRSLDLLRTVSDILDFPGGSDSEASAYNGLIPGLGRSPGEGNGNPLQYSCLENPMDEGAW